MKFMAIVIGGMQWRNVSHYVRSAVDKIIFPDICIIGMIGYTYE